ITYSDSVTAGNCVNQVVSVIMRHWTIIDDCGNSISQDQTITIKDTAARCCGTNCPPVSGAIRSGFNGTAISTNNFIWFNANFNAKGIPSTGATIFFRNSTLVITSAAGNFNYAVPDGKIVFTPGVTCATTMFDGAMWVTTVPLKDNDEILLSAL